MYRGNHQARLFEDALRSARIPYQISGGQSFYDKAEIKDVLSYLRLLANPDDDPAFLRAATTPKRGIGDTTLGKLNDYAKQHECSLFQAAQSMEALAALNAKNREAVQQFVYLMQDYQAQAAGHVCVPRAEPFYRRNAAGRFGYFGAQRRQADCFQRRRAGAAGQYAGDAESENRAGIAFQAAQALMQPETEHGVSPPYPLFPLP